MLSTYQKSKSNRQLFNDGVIRGIRAEGPRIKEDLTRDIPFGSKTIGESRFFHAMGEKISLSRLIVVPYDRSIIGSSRVILDDFKTGEKGKVYRVIQLQELIDSAPPALQLSLEEIETDYEDWRLKYV